MNKRSIKNNSSEKEWLKDFQEFMDYGMENPLDPIKEVSIVPKELSERIFRFVRSDLQPKISLVFFKLFGIHIVLGTLSLAICDQFGLNPFQTSFSLAHYFIKLGHSTCMALCGFLFIGLSVSFSFLILSKNELLVLKKNALLQVFALSTLSLAGLIAFGADVALAIALFWLLGALAGGLSSVFLLGQNLKNTEIPIP